RITVRPPWYRTGWAYALWIRAGGVMLAGGVRFGVHLQTRRLAARNRMLGRLVDEQTAEINAQKRSLEEVVVSLEAAYEEVQTVNENLLNTNHALEERTDQLHQALEANKEILGITAHDLKNPLGGIIGLAEMILEDARADASLAYESVEDNLPLLKDEAERVLQIIKDLLDRHREGEELQLRKARVDLGGIITSVVRWNTKQAVDKGISLHADIEEPILVEVDEVSIQRVLDNYVSNAIKYSPPQRNVWIEIARGAASDTPPVIRVSVRDEGPGLTEEDKQKVFGKMQRLSAKPTRGEHSTGLGLYIVKQLVEAHGGRVGVESEPGKGATFWFSLPAG
ncbi:MAG: HAMP domain-containing sensor histidine kinase, partial [Rhodothermales bacterium]